MSKVKIEGMGYILGTGYLWNPRVERINGLYRFVGLTEIYEDGEWLNIEPSDKEDGWLSEVGPGQLVFIPIGEAERRSTLTGSRGRSDGG